MPSLKKLASLLSATALASTALLGNNCLESHAAAGDIVHLSPGVCCKGWFSGTNISSSPFVSGWWLSVPAGSLGDPITPGSNTQNYVGLWYTDDPQPSTVADLTRHDFDANKPSGDSTNGYFYYQSTDDTGVAVAARFTSLFSHRYIIAGQCQITNNMWDESMVIGNTFLIFDTQNEDVLATTEVLPLAVGSATNSSIPIAFSAETTLTHDHELRYQFYNGSSLVSPLGPPTNAMTLSAATYMSGDSCTTGTDLETIEDYWLACVLCAVDTATDELSWGPKLVLNPSANEALRITVDDVTSNAINLTINPAAVRPSTLNYLLLSDQFQNGSQVPIAVGDEQKNIPIAILWDYAQVWVTDDSTNAMLWGPKLIKNPTRGETLDYSVPAFEVFKAIAPQQAALYFLTVHPRGFTPDPSLKYQFGVNINGEDEILIGSKGSTAETQWRCPCTCAHCHMFRDPSDDVLGPMGYFFVKVYKEGNPVLMLITTQIINSGQPYQKAGAHSTPHGALTPRLSPYRICRFS